MMMMSNKYTLKSVEFPQRATISSLNFAATAKWKPIARIAERKNLLRDPGMYFKEFVKSIVQDICYIGRIL